MNWPFHRKQSKPNAWHIAGLAAFLLIIGFLIGYFSYRQDALLANKSPLKADTAAVGNETLSNLNPLPDGSAEFSALVKQLDTPDKVIGYMKNNFTVISEESQTALSPVDLFLKKIGGPQDIAVFMAFVLDYHSYETGVLEYTWIENGENKYHAVAVFRDGNTPKYLVTTPAGMESVSHGWSFKDLLKKEEARTGISIEEYNFFVPGQTDLTANDWVKNK